MTKLFSKKERTPSDSDIESGPRNSFSLKHELSLILAGAGTGLSFGAMSIFTKACSTELPSTELLATRGGVGLFFGLLICRLNQSVDLLFIPSRSLILRSIFAFISISCFYYNLSFSFASTAIAYTALAPVFVAFLSWILFKEQIGAVPACGVLLAGTGAFLINFNASLLPRTDIFVAGIAGAIFSSLSLVMLKVSSPQHPTSVVVVWFHFTLLLLSAIWGGDSWKLPSLTVLPALAAMSICALTGQILLTWTMRKKTAAFSTTLAWTDILWVSLYELFGTDHPPPLINYVAAFLILAGAFMVGRGKRGELERQNVDGEQVVV